MKKVLTIAGSDTSGGAGIQADLKTFQEYNVYGMSALTVIVTMDPHNNWNHGVTPLGLSLVKEQLTTVVDGIGIDAMKTGMLPTTDIIELAYETIKKNGLKNVVIDPVMVCKGANEPISPENTVCYKETLVTVATVVTPNIFEASQLSGMPSITTVEDMKEAAGRIKELGAGCVVIKGGSKTVYERDGQKIAIDVAYDGKTFELLESELVDTAYTHGAGCTFSAAITAALAKGMSVHDAIHSAKSFITEAVRYSFPLNKFIGPVNHAASRAGKDK